MPVVVTDIGVTVVDDTAVWLVVVVTGLTVVVRAKVVVVFADVALVLAFVVSFVDIADAAMIAPVRSGARSAIAQVPTSEMKRCTRKPFRPFPIGCASLRRSPPS